MQVARKSSKASSISGISSVPSILDSISNTNSDSFPCVFGLFIVAPLSRRKSSCLCTSSLLRPVFLLTKAFAAAEFERFFA